VHCRPAPLPLHTCATLLHFCSYDPGSKLLGLSALAHPRILSCKFKPMSCSALLSTPVLFCTASAYMLTVLVAYRLIR
jgi:hypothetical protein